MTSLEVAQPRFDIEALKDTFSVIKGIKKQREEKLQEIEEIRTLEHKVRKSLISLRQNLLIAKANKDPKKIEVAEAKLADAEQSLAGLQEMRQDLLVPVTGLGETLQTQSTQVMKEIPGIDHIQVCEVSLRVMSALDELRALFRQVDETKELYHMATGDPLQMSVFNGGDSWHIKKYPEDILEELSKILSRNFYLIYLTPDQAAQVADYKERY